MSMICAPDRPTDPEAVEAEAPVKVTVPKLTSGTRAPFCSKSSTIHSALVSQREPLVCDVKVCETDLFLVTFLIVAGGRR